MLRVRKRLLVLFVLIFPILYLSLLILQSVSLINSLRNKDLDVSEKHAKSILVYTDWTKVICGECNQQTFISATLSPILAVRSSAAISLKASQLAKVGMAAFRAILNNKPDEFISNWDKVMWLEDDMYREINLLKTRYQVANMELLFTLGGKKEEWQKLQEIIDTYTNNKNTLRSFLQVIPDIVGVGTEKKYTILLQNNMEIRPTGGFMGSYAQLVFQNGGLATKHVQDIYVPDGALFGHVEPPGPLQAAFKTGEWRLRDSNWNPDFPQAVKTVSWFFEKGGVTVGDGIIAINLSVMEDVINVIGSIALSDYGQEISKENLYLSAQNIAENNFFPGSTQKKDFLQALSNNVFLRANSITPDMLYQLTRSIQKHLYQKNIQFNFHDEKLQKLVLDMKWDGRLVWEKGDLVTNDYLTIIDANLGASKANCCVERTVNQTVTDGGDRFVIHTSIQYSNHSPVARAKPPKYWGSDYVNYVRVLLPHNVLMSKISVAGSTLQDHEVDKILRQDLFLQEYGFFVKVPHLTDTVVELMYSLPKEPNSSNNYQLTLQKQSGIPLYWHVVEFKVNDTSQFTKRLMDHDQIIRFK